MDAPTLSQQRATPDPAAGLPAWGHLATQVLHFARLLRRAGLPIGSDRVLWAVRALQAGALQRRSTCHAALSACLLDRPEQQALFDEAFEVFWRPLPQGSVAPGDAGPPEDDGAGSVWPDPTSAGADPVSARDADAAAEGPPRAALSRRLQDALGRSDGPATSPPRPDRGADDASRLGGAASTWERLRGRDFATLSSEEFRDAMQVLVTLPQAFAPLPTRRRAPACVRGRVDGRATMRAAARDPADLWRLRQTKPRPAPPTLVLLADISGSMTPYTRMALHLAHTLSQGPVRTESFVFGTRLTRLTPWLRQRDPDQAIARASAAVQDWSGGTRIAPSLHAFNQHWARRVPGSRTTVLLLTDGLERGDTAALGFEMERLHKSCRRLIWLNPLLRYTGFEARAAGVRAMRPHVDAFLPVHHLDSLARLLQTLRDGSPR